MSTPSSLARRENELDVKVPTAQNAHESNPAVQFALSRLDEATLSHVPIGVLRSVSRPTYDDLVRAQVDEAKSAIGGKASDDDLASLLAGNDTWTVTNS